MSVRQLTIVLINGRAYFRDDRLSEYRAVDNPHERITFEALMFAEVIRSACSLSSRGAR